MEERTGLQHISQLDITARKAGFTNDDYTKLAQSEERCRNVLLYLRGRAEIRPVQHLIDCDAKPYIPEWAVGIEEHVPGGQIAWNASKVRLYLDERQKGNKHVEGNKLRQAFKGQPMMNANVLDYLLAHPELIPEDWKGKAVFFWGTIYRNADGGLYVRCLRRNDARWYSSDGWLCCAWTASGPAAVLTS